MPVDRYEAMQLFKYKEDRIPTAIIVGWFLADLCVYFFAESLLLACAWMLLGIWPKACICAWNHHHQHLPTFRQEILNRLLEIAYAFHTGITTNAWVLHHVVGHHVNYLDQTKDESGWKTRAGRKMGVFEYTMTIALTGYPRAVRLARDFPRYQRAFFGMGALVAALLALLMWLDWRMATIVFALPMLTGYVITCWHTYYHHAGLDTDDHFQASYNIMHKWYNIMTGNLGYHTAHHIKAGLHWSKLPEYHSQIASSIPPHLYREPCFPFYLLPSK